MWTLKSLAQVTALFQRRVDEAVRKSMKMMLTKLKRLNSQVHTLLVKASIPFLSSMMQFASPQFLERHRLTPTLSEFHQAPQMSKPIVFVGLRHVSKLRIRRHHGYVSLCLCLWPFHLKHLRYLVHATAICILAATNLCLQ